MRLIVLSGLPGSGKSTMAREICLQLTPMESANTEVIHWDEERKFIPDPTDAEVTAWVISRASDCLRNHMNVIVDACNLHPCDYVRWETLAYALGARFDWVDVQASVPVSTCIERDSKRENPVGGDRILKLHYDSCVLSKECPRITKRRK